LQKDVSQSEKEEGQVQDKGQAQTQDTEENKSENGRSFPQASGSERSLGFDRMKLILLDIPEVVPDINGARKHAKQGEGKNGLQNQRNIEYIFRKDEGCEDKKVFGPLVRPQGFENFI